MAQGFWRHFEPGSLNKRVTFLRQAETEDALGKTTNGLEPVITLWADLYPVRGRESYETAKIQSNVTHKCYCRWHSALADINSDWYLEYKGKRYSIESAADAGLEHRYIEIYCAEHTGDADMPDARTDEGGEDIWTE